MKRIFKKNQIIIAALAVMIAAAGYLNYSGIRIRQKRRMQNLQIRNFWTYPRRT